MRTLIPRFAFALWAALFVAIAACAQDPVAYDVSPPSAQLDQLVAPIALYPDALVAQVLAASAYPDQIADAAAWMRQNANLKGTQLAAAVDAQPWDPSVKALTQFPSVLSNMDRNRSWTSALGEAYASQPAAVMDAVQVMRRRAQAAGNLRSTAQQIVTTQGETIVIQPANPSVVYLPAYDPWLVYGSPVLAYPDWIAVPGLYYAGPGLYWGPRFDIGFFAAFGWGWHHWGADWHGRVVLHDHAPWHVRGPAFAHRAPPAREFRAPEPRPELRYEPRERAFERGEEMREGGGLREGGGFRGGRR